VSAGAVRRRAARGRSIAQTAQPNDFATSMSTSTRLTIRRILIWRRLRSIWARAARASSGCTPRSHSLCWLGIHERAQRPRRRGWELIEDPRQDVGDSHAVSAAQVSCHIDRLQPQPGKPSSVAQVRRHEPVPGIRRPDAPVQGQVTTHADRMGTERIIVVLAVILEPSLTG
jgi:hypothetical protein